MKKMITIGVLAGMFFAGQALAGDEMKKAAAATAEEKFATLDADQDGFVTPEEATQLKGLPERFADADTDGDGKLILTEFSEVEGE